MPSNRLAENRPRQLAPWSNGRLSSGLAVSVLLHSLPLLALIGWQAAPVEIPKAIPIELVLEQPPPPPPLPEPPAVPPPIRAASADLAEVAAARTEPGVASAAPASAEPKPAGTEPPAPAEVRPPPEAAPAEEPAQPSSSETKTALLSPPPPKPTPRRQQPLLPMSLPGVSAWPLPLHQDRPHEAPRRAALIGPPAVRDEYCERALYLTMRHIDLLPRSYVGDRRGRTVVKIRILGDGTINSVKLAQSSGYPDIDQRVEKMVFAVGQYPPLPPRMPGPSMDFSFIMVFPEAIEP